MSFFDDLASLTNGVKNVIDTISDISNSSNPAEVWAKATNAISNQSKYEDLDPNYGNYSMRDVQFFVDNGYLKEVFPDDRGHYSSKDEMVSIDGLRFIKNIEDGQDTEFDNLWDSMKKTHRDVSDENTLGEVFVNAKVNWIKKDTNLEEFVAWGERPKKQKGIKNVDVPVFSVGDYSHLLHSKKVDPTNSVIFDALPELEVWENAPKKKIQVQVDNKIHLGKLPRIDINSRIPFNPLNNTIEGIDTGKFNIGDLGAISERLKKKGSALVNESVLNNSFSDLNTQYDSRLTYMMASKEDKLKSFVTPHNPKEGFTIFAKSILPNFDPEDRNKGKEQFEYLKKTPEGYGVPAIMNPYSLIRLYNALELGADSNGTINRVKVDYAIDRHRRRKWYDISQDDGDPTKSMINIPTTTNIIKWGNSDEWGRFPYKFQDFVFCKWWNIVPNNRLLTIRRYHSPTTDNLNFDGMYKENGEKDKSFSPLSTIVSFFGEETGNTLSNMLSFSAGYNWKTYTSQMFDVGLSGSKGNGNKSSIIGGVMQGGLFGTSGQTGASFESDVISFILSTMLGGGEFPEMDASSIRAQIPYPDPYNNGPWMNKVRGPLNSIDNVQGRDKGLHYQNSLKITCSYVARPFSGVNVKAVLLDILANSLLMGYSSGNFFKGGHRFKITPSLFKPNDNLTKIMDFIYKGDIDSATNMVVDLITDLLKKGRLTSLMENVANGVGTFVNQAGDLVKGGFNGEGISGEQLANTFKGGVSAFSQSNIGSLARAMLTKLVTETGMIQFFESFGAILNGDPTGEWHLTIGNPMNPIATIGNLVCKDMQVTFSDELGPDDFPLEMDVVYTFEHGMPRDSDAIQSMFNRGIGRIYTLPDWAKTSSDYMTQVDKYIGSNQDGRSEENGSYWTSVTDKMKFNGIEHRQFTLGNGGEKVTYQETFAVNSADSVIAIPKYLPLNPEAKINLLLSPKELAPRGLFYVDSVDKYAEMVGKN